MSRTTVWRHKRGKIDSREKNESDDEAESSEESEDRSSSDEEESNSVCLVLLSCIAFDPYTPRSLVYSDHNII